MVNDVVVVADLVRCELPAFASTVLYLLRHVGALPTERFGARKVFISAVYDRARAADHHVGSREVFGARLVECLRLGLLELARADLVSAMHPAAVARSETRDNISTFHFVVDPHVRDPWEAAPTRSPHPPGVPGRLPGTAVTNRGDELVLPALICRSDDRPIILPYSAHILVHTDEARTGMVRYVAEGDLVAVHFAGEPLTKVTEYPLARLRVARGGRELEALRRQLAERIARHAATGEPYDAYLDEPAEDAGAGEALS
jgi:hypothetical protein